VNDCSQTAARFEQLEAIRQRQRDRSTLVSVVLEPQRAELNTQPCAAVGGQCRFDEWQSGFPGLPFEHPVQTLFDLVRIDVRRERLELLL
jgi:hypothetical protein